MPGYIVVKGARVHNLKNIDVEIPRDRLVVVTGVSGSGKSSLAFDTLYAEGQRRYLESLAIDARQFLQQLEKPDVDSIEGLSPAIAIQAKAGISSPRSTVGTMTEIYDYLRLMFARIGQPTCLQCGREVVAENSDRIIDRLRGLPSGSRLIIMAPVRARSKREIDEKLTELARQGFVRVMINGELHELSDKIDLQADPPYAIDLVVDRLSIREGVDRRLADSIEVGLRFGNGLIKVAITEAGSEAAGELMFNQKFVCISCGIAVPELTPRLFSFNSPQGACPACGGLGLEPQGVTRSGIQRRSEDQYACPKCNGTRLKHESLTVKLGGKNIAELAAMSVSEAGDFLAGLKLEERTHAVAAKILDETVSRLRFLVRLGLDYLTLDRRSPSLSGGEAERVRLATQIGSKLAGVLYILDEPSIGLHQRDTAQLLDVLRNLRDSGNSVVVVEHDPETILAAQWVIDMGPGAGLNGGQIIAQGTPDELMNDPLSLTGQYLSGRLTVPVPPAREQGNDFLIIEGVRENNLKNLTVKFPLGAITCVTGVSGSGKSSLVMDSLFNAVTRRLRPSHRRHDERFGALRGWEHFDRVIGVDQAPLGRAPRSNPATYTGAYEHIRDLFAQLPEAKIRGYKAERFSFNVSGGRCENCAGEGVIRLEMYFLPELHVVCDACQGKRYNRETLEIKYKGSSIADVLDLSVNQALELLSAIPPLAAKLRALCEVGLGYLRLGQPAPSLSGGEAQRVKLARELARRSTGRSLYVLDEPTSGLHFEDVRQLSDVLQRLTVAGNTVIIVEHNLDIIKSADYIVDLGPEGGLQGGRIVAEGTPEEIAACERSYTGRYLKKLLSNQLSAKPVSSLVNQYNPM